MGKRERALTKIVDLLVRYFCADKEVAKDLSEKIYKDVVEPAVEEERNEWIVFAKSAPDSPDGRGLDS